MVAVHLVKTEVVEAIEWLAMAMIWPVKFLGLVLVAIAFIGGYAMYIVTGAGWCGRDWPFALGYWIGVILHPKPSFRYLIDFLDPPENADELDKELIPYGRFD